jgi:hypothetical protein
VVKTAARGFVGEIEQKVRAWAFLCKAWLFSGMTS